MQKLMTIDEINTCAPGFLEPAEKSGYVCPVCQNGTGASGTGLDLYFNSKGKPKWHCFKVDCGLDTDTTDLIKIAFNLDNTAQIQAKAQELKEQGKLVPGSIKTAYKAQKGSKKGSARVDYVLECSELANNMTDKDYAYLESRGISKETQKRFMVGYNALTRRVRIPDLTIDEHGKLHAFSYAERDTTGKAEKKILNSKGGEQDLFNGFALNNEIVFVCESQINAMSIEELGFNALAVKGVQGIERLMKAIEEKNIKDKTFIVAFDNDNEGKKATIKLLKMIRDSNNFAVDMLKHVKFTKNDCNDELVSDKENFKRMLEKCAKNYEELVNEELFAEYDVKSLEHEFLNPEERISSVELKTGFANLDDFLSGGLHEGLYILGAISSLGKTTFCLNLAHNIIAKNTNADVIFISLEQSKREIISKLISRETFVVSASNAWNTSEILNSNQWKNQSDIKKRVYQACSESLFDKIKGRLFIYNELENARIGADEIRTIVERHKSRFKRDVIVIVDYLQILKGNDKKTDKQNTDEAVFQLKGISRDFNIPVLAISSFNRDSYSNEVSMSSFKESGAIEYSSDVLLGLQFSGQGGQGFNIENAMNATPRNVVLKILKNRNGRNQTNLSFKFNAEFNHYAEGASVINSTQKNKVPKII